MQVPTLNLSKVNEAQVKLIYSTVMDQSNQSGALLSLRAQLSSERSKRSAVFPQLSSQTGRSYYFKNIHEVNKSLMAKHQCTDPLSNGFVPYSQTTQPSLSQREQAYLKKLDVTGELQPKKQVSDRTGRDQLIIVDDLEGSRQKLELSMLQIKASKKPEVTQLLSPALSLSLGKSFKKMTRQKAEVLQGQKKEQAAYLTRLVRDTCVYTKGSRDNEWPQLTEAAERIFRQIAETGTADNIRNLKVEKKKLKKFLQDRYSLRVATKMVGLFDFALALDYRTFYKQLFEHMIEPADLLDTARQFAFNLYDVNCDRVIDQNDLFAFITDLKSRDVLTEACYQDIHNIQEFIKERQIYITKEDPVMEGAKICDLPQFLANSVKRQSQRDNFLSIFCTRNTYGNLQKPQQKQTTDKKAKTCGVTNMLQEAVGLEKGQSNKLATITRRAEKLYGLKQCGVKLEEANQVWFQSGYPKIYLHFIEALCGDPLLASLHQHEHPPMVIPLIHYDSPEMQALRLKVNERFYNYVFLLFDRLGDVEPELIKDMKQADKEPCQFISYGSLCAKMHTIFGTTHKYFAKLLFNFLSGGKLLNTRINFQMWLEKLMPFWLKSSEIFNANPVQPMTDSNHLKQRDQAINELVFDLLNISGHKEIQIIDLIDLCSNLLPTEPLGKTVHHMLELFTSKNLRPRYNPTKLCLDCTTFVKTFGSISLAKELDVIFCRQFININKLSLHTPDYLKERLKVPAEIKLMAFQDEATAGPAYWEALQKQREFFKLLEIQTEFQIDP